MADSSKKTHWIRHGLGDFKVDDDGRSVAEIKTFLLSLDPDGVKTAATAYRSAATVLARTLDTIDDVSAELARIWEGDASVRTQRALRLLHVTIRDLCGGIDRMDGPLDALGETLRHHKDVVENTGGSWSKVTFDLLGSINDSVPDVYRTIDHGWEFGPQDEPAGRHLRALNNDLAEIFPRFPDSVEKEPPGINPQAGPEIDLTDVDLSPGRDLPESWPSSPRAGRQGGVPTGLDLGDQSDFGSPDLADTSGDRGAEPGGPDPSPHRRGDDLAPGHGRDGDVTGRPPADSLGHGDHNRSAGEGSTALSFYRPADTATSPTLITNPHGAQAPPTGQYGGTGGTAGGRPAAPSRTAGGTPTTPMTGAGAGRGRAREEETRERSAWLFEDDLVWTGRQEDTVHGLIG
ncbi:hypothetical protein FH608_040610 [Nonomuraea phyllanthi]|uniref:Uncharacterized protein n=1 Tax=Nonomuraea phyllanthi TaxID=2219224 RepID=A0A5C4VKV6_9ACTN|nr:hypothetical protein [Nonomuraea phyllanthi]KAB8189149.1 hypothetical protein FH608_040610 [Nonomuraea phyllanthi]